MAVFMIAAANLKKKKGVALSTGLLIILSVALFHVGLTLILDIQNFYERENNRLMGPHYTVRFYGNEYEDKYLDFLTSDTRVESASVQEIAIMDMAEFVEGGTISANFKNMDLDTAIRGYQIAEEGPDPEKEGIYLPTYFKDLGYRVGGQLTLISHRQTYTFPIAGFIQSTWFASSVTSIADIYMHEEAFQNLYGEIGGGYLLLTRLKNPGELDNLRRDFKEQTQIPIKAISLNADIMEFSIRDMKTGCTLVVTIISAVLLAFSVLMIAIAVIVMKFRIGNYIESQMVNIGALEAMGYTGSQIKWSVALEFLLVGLISVPVGILLSYGILASLGQLIVTSVGVSYRQGNHLVYDVTAALIMMFLVTWLSQACASKAAKIPPIQALRQGMESHSFQKNHIPLDKTSGSVSILLGLKQTVFYKRIYLMTGVIFAAVSFSFACAVILFFNLGIDDSLVLKLSGYEISDLVVYKTTHADYDELLNDLGQVPGVRKTNLYEAVSVTIEGELLTCYLSDNFDGLEMAAVYEGSFPEYDNEIVVTGVLAKAWGKQIGDLVTVQSENGVQAEFIICGLSQTMNTFGRQCSLNRSGYLLLEPSYEPGSIQLYLDPGQNLEDMIKTLEQTFLIASPSFRDLAGEEKALAKKTAEEKIANLLSMYGVDSAQYALMDDGQIILSGDTLDYRIDRIDNNRRMFLSNINSMATSVGLLSFIIVAATLFIILLVLYLVIKTMLVRQRREFGIYKSMGYTDRQLRTQIAVSFLPASAGGITLGLLAAYKSVNRLASLMFEQLGISRMELFTDPFVLFFLGVLLVLFSYGISYFVSRRMKDITVYELLTEV